MVIGNYEQFIANVRDSGSDTLEITIESKVAKFMGLKAGDLVKVQIKKSQPVRIRRRNRKAY